MFGAFVIYEFHIYTYAYTENELFSLICISSLLFLMSTNNIIAFCGETTNFAATTRHDGNHRSSASNDVLYLIRASSCRRKSYRAAHGACELHYISNSSLDHYGPPGI